MSNPQVQSLTVNGTTYDIVDNTSGYMTGMTILSYGNSTWQDFIDAYTAKKVVYCRASSQSNPATGSQTRLAFMAYVNNVESPTEVEFQYYRSVSSKTESQQGDQVFIYTLTSSGSWSVITREASVKVAVGGDLNGSYSGGTYTISADIPDQNVISVDQKVTTGVNIADITINGVITELYAPQGGGSSGTITRVKTTAGAHTAIDVSSGSASFNVPTKTSHLTNDSGFVTTDEKLSTTLASDGWHCLLLGTASSTASTKYYSTGLKCSTSSTSVWLSLGTNSSDGPQGELTLYGRGAKGVDISVPDGLTKNVAVKLPSAEGTLALIEDIPTVPTNVSDLVNDSGYITGISSSDVTTALGYTPYNSTNPNGYTSNTGTITGITMNGSSKGTSGVVNLGTVVTDVFLDGTSVVSSGTAELTSATLTASDDGNGNVTLGLTGIGTLSTASGVSF